MKQKRRVTIYETMISDALNSCIGGSIIAFKFLWNLAITLIILFWNLTKLFLLILIISCLFSWIELIQSLLEFCSLDNKTANASYFSFNYAKFIITLIYKQYHCVYIYIFESISYVIEFLYPHLKWIVTSVYDYIVDYFSKFYSAVLSDLNRIYTFIVYLFKLLQYCRNESWVNIKNDLYQYISHTDIYDNPLVWVHTNCIIIWRSCACTLAVASLVTYMSRNRTFWGDGLKILSVPKMFKTFIVLNILTIAGTFFIYFHFVYQILYSIGNNNLRFIQFITDTLIFMHLYSLVWVVYLTRYDLEMFWVAMNNFWEIDEEILHELMLDYISMLFFFLSVFRMYVCIVVFLVLINDYNACLSGFLGLEWQRKAEICKSYIDNVLLSPIGPLAGFLIDHYTIIIILLSFWRIISYAKKSNNLLIERIQFRKDLIVILGKVGKFNYLNNNIDN